MPPFSIFEIVPLVLAFVAVLLCSFQYGVERRKSTRISLLTAMFASLGYIVVQSYWWATNAMQCDTEELYKVTIMLIIYNTLTMIAFITMAIPRVKK
jgi:hypothetical protein